MKPAWLALFPALLVSAAFTLPTASAEVEVTTYTQDQSCQRLRSDVQNSASGRETLLWRGERGDEFNLAYPRGCPLRGWYTAPFSVETRDHAECFVGYCCVGTKGDSCRGR